MAIAGIRADSTHRQVLALLEPVHIADGTSANCNRPGFGSIGDRLVIPGNAVAPVVAAA